MGLIAITHCPVCGNTGRSPATDGIAAQRPDAGRYYLEHAAAQLGMPLEQLLESIKVYQCTNCKSYFCDPWISVETAAYVFTQGAPDHIAGWANFEHWLSSSPLNLVESANACLYQLLQEKLGAITSYAEYACPFQGLLLHFARTELTLKERVHTFAQAIHRHADIRWTTAPRLHHAGQGLAHHLVVLYHRLRAYKYGKSTPRTVKPVLPKQRQLLTQSNTRAWGNNCVRYGASCNYYATKLLAADVLPFAERLQNAQANPGATTDLLGLFNILDHTDNPLAVIKDGLTISRHLIIVTHHAAAAGKQHLFAFHASFSDWLAGVLPNAITEDLSQVMQEKGYPGYTFVLISRK